MMCSGCLSGMESRGWAGGCGLMRGYEVVGGCGLMRGYEVAGGCGLMRV